MTNTFGIRRLSRTGRTFVTGRLVCFLVLAVSGPIALLGLACGAANFAPTSESTSEECPDGEGQVLVEMCAPRFSRRLVGGRQVEVKLGSVFQGMATFRFARTHVRHLPLISEHDRRNGFGAPLRC